MNTDPETGEPLDHEADDSIDFRAAITRHDETQRAAYNQQLVDMRCALLELQAVTAEAQARCRR